MTGLIVRDSAKIQAQDAERTHRKRKSDDAPEVRPLYTMEEMETILKQLRPVPYCDPVDVAPGIKARYAEAGHMLGSASIQLLVDEDGAQKKIVFLR